ncbi:MAG: hypothetical protein AB8B72_10230 [Crocinitomicaceae bacterium]
MRKIRIPTFCFIAALSILACNKKVEKEVIGLKPVYATEATLEKVEVIVKESIDQPGKIYVYENYLLVNDQSKGIHIYDNSNTNSPVHLSFISIPGNMDFSVRNNTIYADNVTDLVVIDMSQAAKPEVINRMKSVFPSQTSPNEQGFFECVDASKGTVVRWEKGVLTNPGCSK